MAVEGDRSDINYLSAFSHGPSAAMDVDLDPPAADSGRVSPWWDSHTRTPP